MSSVLWGAGNRDHHEGNCSMERRKRTRGTPRAKSTTPEQNKAQRGNDRAQHSFDRGCPLHAVCRLWSTQRSGGNEPSSCRSVHAGDVSRPTLDCTYRNGPAQDFTSWLNKSPGLKHILPPPSRATLMVCTSRGVAWLTMGMPQSGASRRATPNQTIAITLACFCVAWPQGMTTDAPIHTHAFKRNRPTNATMPNTPESHRPIGICGHSRTI